MFNYTINANRDEMLITLDGTPVYRAGYHRSMDAEKTFNAFRDCVKRLQKQLVLPKAYDTSEIA
jgi:hypothetical protein